MDTAALHFNNDYDYDDGRRRLRLQPGPYPEFYFNRGKGRAVRWIRAPKARVSRRQRRRVSSAEGARIERRRRKYRGAEGAEYRAPKARESRRQRRRVGRGMGRGYPPPQPTRGSGGASWAPPAGCGAQPRPKTILVLSGSATTAFVEYLSQILHFFLQILRLNHHQLGCRPSLSVSAVLRAPQHPQLRGGRRPCKGPQTSAKNFF